jgi:hypothetical protein
VIRAHPIETFRETSTRRESEKEERNRHRKILSLEKYDWFFNHRAWLRLESCKIALNGRALKIERLSQYCPNDLIDSSISESKSKSHPWKKCSFCHRFNLISQEIADQMC